MSLTALFTISAFVKLLAFCSIGWILYEPVPLNSEKLVLTYLIYLMRRISRIYNQSIISIKVLLGYGTYPVLEANRRRKPVENLNPKLAQNCSEEIIEILDRKLELRIYRPNERQSDHAIIYFHGGGFVMCHAKMYRLFLSNLAVHTNSIVFCVNYRKAPEHPFPAAQLDAFDSTLFIFENANKFEFSPDNAIFTGDSAGGLLSVNCWYRFQLSNYSFKPSGICLLYPALGYQLDTPSFQRNTMYPPLNLQSCTFFVFCLTDENHSAYQYKLLRENEHYDSNLIPDNLKDLADPKLLLDKEEQRNWIPKKKRTKFTSEEHAFRQRYTKKIANPFNVPLFIEDDILRHIPPCITFACEHDVLKNDAQMFHARLRKLNKKTEIYVWEGALHAHLVLSEQQFGHSIFTRATSNAIQYFNAIANLLTPQC